MTRAGLIQLCSSDDPVENLVHTCGLVADAAADGARLIVTPEVTNCVSASRAHQMQVLRHEGDDVTLAALREQAAGLGVWVVIGSLAIKTDDPDGRFANRSYVIAPNGDVAARYDKIHMFDVQISDDEKYAESKGYRPGARAVVVDTDVGRIGLSICYDMRFGALYRTLADAGAQIITAPSAFSPVTGAAHWHVLLRARAIETGAFVLAPAQVGTHAAQAGKVRRTYGHSLAVGPWGQVLCDGGTRAGVNMVDLDLASVEHARTALPVGVQQQDFTAP